MSAQLKALGYETPAGKIVFENISLNLHTHHKYGLVGPNGVGKTTLAKILTGEISPSSGRLQKTGEISYFSQFEDPPPIEVEDYLSSVWINASPENRSVIHQLVDSIATDRSCESLSGGEWTRVRLAKAISVGAEFLILDEPTNNLDRKSRLYLIGFIKSYQGGLIIISHDREILSEVDSILEMSNQGLSVYGGGWEFYESQSHSERKKLSHEIEKTKQAIHAAEDHRHEQIQKQEKRMRKGTKDALKSGDPKIILGLKKRKSQNTLARVDEKTQNALEDKLNRNRAALEQVKNSPQIYAEFPETSLPNSKLVLEAENFNFKFRGSAGPLWKNPLSLNIRGPVKMSLQGQNGSGKTTLLNLLTKPESLEGEFIGNLQLGQIKTVYLDQRLSLIDRKLSVYENVQKNSCHDEAELRNLLAQFLFAGDQVRQLAETLSGGEQLRLALAMALLSSPAPQLLILDEPTNNIDILNLEFLEELIIKYEGALIVVSHDKTFIENIQIDQTINLDDYI